MAKKSLMELVTSKSMLSPLCVGQKMTTELLAGKNIIITDADLVSYTEQDAKTGEEKTVEFVVLTVCDDKKKQLGYYQGGKALTEIFAVVLADEDYAKEMRKNGVKIRLVPKRTKGGNNFTAVEVWE